jgi:hypothetical protein
VDGVGDPRTVAQAVEARPAHLPDDVDDEDRAGRCRRDGVERRGDRLRLAGGACVREPLAEEDERCERETHTDERGRAGDGEGHAAIVAASRSHVVHDSVTNRRKSPRARSRS